MLRASGYQSHFPAKTLASLVLELLGPEGAPLGKAPDTSHPWARGLCLAEPQPCPRDAREGLEAPGWESDGCL